jgi:basic amino acid/polyamine antiporter, APA family
MRADASERGEGGKLVRQLTLFDSIMVVVSGTIGASIFITPADVLRVVPDPRFALMLWIVAGGITLMAGLACAELGGMFPEAGGQYVFIREAYGRFAAFLYGWVLFTAGNSGALAAMAIAFALFFGRAFPLFSTDHVIVAYTVFGVHWELNRGSLVAVVSVISRRSRGDRGFGILVRSRFVGSLHRRAAERDRVDLPQRRGNRDDRTTLEL